VARFVHSDDPTLIMTRFELITAIALRFPNLMAKDAEIAVKEILDSLREKCSAQSRKPDQELKIAL
jgi:hypothetical protein